MRRGRTWTAATVLGMTLAICVSSEAGASSFCVPDFGPRCKDNGFNVAVPDLEDALGMDGTDGIADSVVIQPHTYVDPDTLELSGTDHLTINGAGTDETFITSSDNGNQFVMNFSAGSRASVLMRDLTVVIPASFPDNQGAALQLQRTILGNVDVISRNPGSDGIASIVGANTVTGGEYSGESGGTFGDAIDMSGPTGASAVVEGVTIRDASYGFTISDPDLGAAVFRKSRILGAKVAAVEATSGTATVENVFATTANNAEAVAVDIFGPDDAILNVRHMTAHPAAGATSSEAAVNAIIGPGANGDGTANVNSSIFRDYGRTYTRLAAPASATGNAFVTLRYDNIPAPVPQGAATDAGDGTSTFTSVINADPLFVSPNSPILAKGSPSFDTGDPMSPTADDIYNTGRPTEGGGGAPALPDQGAYERDVVKPVATITKGPGKKTKQGGAKFLFESNEADSTFECKIDKKPFKQCGGSRTFTGLKDGKHTFKVRAIDRAGNTGKPAKKKFETG
jgi:hypothetical protein